MDGKEAQGLCRGEVELGGVSSVWGRSLGPPRVERWCKGRVSNFCQRMGDKLKASAGGEVVKGRVSSA